MNKACVGSTSSVMARLLHNPIEIVLKTTKMKIKVVLVRAGYHFVWFVIFHYCDKITKCRISAYTQYGFHIHHKFSHWILNRFQCSSVERNTFKSIHNMFVYMYVFQQTISKTYPRTAERKWETRRKTDVDTDEIDKCNLLNVNVWIKRSSKKELHSLSIDFRWPNETIHFISFDSNIPMNCYNARHRSTKALCQLCSPIITNEI